VDFDKFTGHGQDQFSRFPFDLFPTLAPKAI